MQQLGFVLITVLISLCQAGITPVHDFQTQTKPVDERFAITSPHHVLNHLDSSILKATQNLTNNPKMDETLYQISKDLVTSILSKLEIQDKITRITKEALDASGKNKRITAIETRRILDYISRTLSNNILKITKESTEYELHHLVYGLAQIATEISIVSALKDTTFATVLSRRQSIELSLRKKRSVKKESQDNNMIPLSTTTENSLFDIIFNTTNTVKSAIDDNPIVTRFPLENSIPVPESPFSVMPTNKRKSVHVLNEKSSSLDPPKGFLNKTVLDIENSDSEMNKTNSIIIDKTIKLNVSNNIKTEESFTLDAFESNTPGLIDEWVDTKDNGYKLPLDSDAITEFENDHDAVDEEKFNMKKGKQKIQRLESRAKKAILYAGDVAYLAAASVVAMRRALTASIEVEMSVRLAKNDMTNHQELMMNLAKSAAQQVGKEAKIATSKSLTCEKMLKLAVKYTSQSNGAILNHAANRIVLDTLTLPTLSKSMAFVSSDIAINSLYQATDIKPLM